MSRAFGKFLDFMKLSDQDGRYEDEDEDEEYEDYEEEDGNDSKWEDLEESDNPEVGSIEALRARAEAIKSGCSTKDEFMKKILEEFSKEQLEQLLANSEKSSEPEKGRSSEKDTRRTIERAKAFSGVKNFCTEHAKKVTGAALTAIAIILMAIAVSRNPNGGDIPKDQTNITSETEESAEGNIAPEESISIYPEMEQVIEDGAHGIESLSEEAQKELARAEKVNSTAQSLNNLASEGQGDTKPEESPEIRSLTGVEVLDKTIDGSFSQYDNIGCFESEGKVAEESIGNPNLVLEAMGINPEEATAEQRGIAQEYFGYSQGIATAPVAIIAEIPGFEGLSEEEAIEKIAKMSVEEKLEFQNQLKEDFYDRTTYRYDTGNGLYRNQAAYKDENGEMRTDYIESDLTGKRILVGTTILKDGTIVETTYKDDCGNIEKRVTITHSDGSKEIRTIVHKNPNNPNNPDDPDNPENPDAKNAEAIKRNMQTGDETTNWVEPADSGDLEGHPDTSENSYEAEQEYQAQAVEEAKSQPSESSNGGTVGDVINGADQTYAEHVTYTEDQQDAAAAAEKAAAAQAAADEQAKAAEEEAEQNKTMSDEDAGAWFNDLVGGGNN